MKIVVLQVGENNLVEVFDDPAAVIPVNQPAPEIVNVISAGPQGIPGPVGPPGNDASYLLGVPLAFTSSQPNDLLSFNGSEWRNRPQEDVSDGGNF